MAAEAFWTPIFVSVRVVLVAGALAFVAALVAAAFLKKGVFQASLP